MKYTRPPAAVCELGAEPHLSPHWPTGVVTSELHPDPSELPAPLPTPLKGVGGYCENILVLNSEQEEHLNIYYTKLRLMHLPSPHLQVSPSLGLPSAPPSASPPPPSSEALSPSEPAGPAAEHRIRY